MNEIITAYDLCLWYGSSQALNSINISIPENVSRPSSVLLVAANLPF